MQSLKDKTVEIAGMLGVGTAALVVAGLLLAGLIALVAMLTGALLYVALIGLHAAFEQVPVLTYWQSCAVAFFMVVVRGLLFSDRTTTVVNNK